MTKFYVAGPMGRDRASLELQLWDGDDEVVSPLECEEIIMMPNSVEGHPPAAWAVGKPIAEAHREFARAGRTMTWRLVYDGGGEDLVYPGPDPELERLLAEEEEIERACQARKALLESPAVYPTAPTSISTWTGQRVDPLNFQPSDANVYDIAHALARQCRYNGHVEHFVSVALHSVWVSHRLRNESPELQMWGLLHDATEAYIGDMVKPLKHSLAMTPFREVEDEIEKAIAEAYRLPYPMPDIVKEADRFVTVDVEMGMGLRTTHASTPDEDEALFLERYYDLDARR